MGEAAAAQMRELPFAINWTFAHPRSIELAAEIASLTPGDLNRVFFVSGGSEAVEAAWKLARQYHSARGERRWKAVARRVAYHGTTMGALSITGCTELRTPFEPLVPDALHVANTNRYHRPEGETEEEFTAFLLDDLAAAIEQAGPGHGRDGDHGADPELGRRVHAAGRLLRGRAGDLRRARHPALRRRGDHRLRPHRVLVRVRALRHPARPDHVRQGALLRLRVDRRADRERARHGAVHQAGRDVHPRDDVRRPPRPGGDRAQEHRDHEARRDRRRRARGRGHLPGRSRAAARPPDRRATCAAAATSTRSSSSRTRRRGRASTSRSARSCCAASSPPSCSSAA